MAIVLLNDISYTIYFIYIAVILDVFVIGTILLLLKKSIYSWLYPALFYVQVKIDELSHPVIYVTLTIKLFTLYL